MKGVAAIMFTCRGKWHEDEKNLVDVLIHIGESGIAQIGLGHLNYLSYNRKTQFALKFKAWMRNCRNLRKKHKFSRWSFDRQDLNTHQKVARGARRKEVLSKLHREATERCHLLVVKKHARGYDAMTRMADLLKKVNATNRRLIRDCNHLADLDSEKPLVALP